VTAPAPTKKPKPSAYRSGHCGVGHHDRCLGAYAGAECGCTCHLTCEACGQPVTR